MATKGVMQVQLQGDDHHHQRTNKFSGNQKKEELEREVVVLRKMLEHEEKVHEFLERRQGSNVAIPNFLPPKMKEVLAELSMVENEITRLESQIRQLQADHTKLQKDVKYSSSAKTPNIVEAKEKMAFETKALHFISKAIKGDYNMSDFSVSDQKVMKPRIPVPLPKKFDQEDGGAIHKSFRRSGGAMLKPSSSPMREPRHSTPRRDRNLDIISEQLPPKATTSGSQIASEEDNFHKWSPNKLSENLLKCLLLIFVRLLRTSRTMELEKSGPISRSTNFSSSFRAEPNLSSLHVAHKDSRQQDPYGIFDSEESITRDIGPYKNLIRFTTASMDPKCISTSSSLPLFQKLSLIKPKEKNYGTSRENHEHQLPYRYTASPNVGEEFIEGGVEIYDSSAEISILDQHAFLQHGVPSNSNPEELLILLNQTTLNVGGITITAQTIEHTILRKSTSSLIKEVATKGSNGDLESNKVVRERFGVEPFEPNVTFALCCGTRSSPAVKIYTGEGVMAELEKSKLEYLQASIMVMSTRRIAIPEHLLMHIYDFAEDVESLMEWVCHQLPTSGSLRKSIVDCFRGIAIGKASTIIDKIPYDFEFQYLMAM